MAVDKHINFFELQKAAEKPGCPLCRIVSDRAERYIDNLLFEHVADRGFRALHRASGGFCAYHSRNLQAFRDGLAVAILSRDILEDRIASFEHRKPWNPIDKQHRHIHHKGRKHGHWNPKGKCPICVERDSIEEEYLSFLAASDGDSPEEKELRAAFTASEGLCAPHYSKLLFNEKGKPRTLPRWLKEFHETKFRELLRRVSQFIELSAYGRQAEFALLSEKDQLVWKEAAIVLRGSE
jgi:hypothetical protein